MANLETLSNTAKDCGSEYELGLPPTVKLSLPTEQNTPLETLCYGAKDCRFESGPEVINTFSCSTQLSMNFFLLIHIKMPTIVGILIFMSGKNSILGLSEPKKPNFLILESLRAFKIPCSTQLSMKKVL